MKKQLHPVRWQVSIPCLLLAFLFSSTELVAQAPSGDGIEETGPENEFEIIGEFVYVIGTQSSMAGDLTAEQRQHIIEGAIDALQDVALEIAGPENSSVERGLRRLFRNPEEYERVMRRLSNVTSRNGFEILYTPGAMRMNAEGESMILTAGTPARMSFADHQNEEITRALPFSQEFDPRFRTSTTVATSSAGVVDTTPESETAIGAWAIHAEYETQQHNVNFEVTMGPAGSKVYQWHEGSVWVAPDHPGTRIVAAFYRNFAGAIQSTGFLGDFAGGLTQIMAQLSASGLPMEGDLEIVTQGSILGMPTARLKTRKEFEVLFAWVLPLNRAMLRTIFSFEEEIGQGYKLVELLAPPPSPGAEFDGVGGTIRSGAKMWKDALKRKFRRKKNKKPDD